MSFQPHPNQVVSAGGTSVLEKLTSVPFAETHKFSKVVIDYLQEAPTLAPFYHRSPNPASFAGQIEEKLFDGAKRAVLVNALERQYGGKLPASAKLLALENTYTITTGHQLGLFSGPLYVVYKIATAIRMCQDLAKRYPGKNFVPVFWLASEDHDFDEINHTFVNGKRIEWSLPESRGAVGRITLPPELNSVIDQYVEALPPGKSRSDLEKVIRQAYKPGVTLQDATRLLIAFLFSETDLVIIDGDDAELKREFIPVISKELLENFSHKAMERTNQGLSQHYNLQVHQREINLFYLTENSRERLVSTEQGEFQTLSGSHHWTTEEILAHVNEHPEKFSPNVVLRPVYQETILPNLAYVGGGGELAYWFQLKDVFDSIDLPMPILWLRNSVALLSAGDRKIMADLNLRVPDLFKPYAELERQLVLLEKEELFNLSEDKKELSHFFQRLASRLQVLNPQLKSSAGAAQARAERLLNNLEKKAYRHAKRKSGEVLSRLTRLFQSLFPGEGLQERSENMGRWYALYGKDFVHTVLNSIEPFEDEFIVLVEPSTTTTSPLLEL